VVLQCNCVLFVVCSSALAGLLLVVFLARGLSYAGFVSSFNWSVRMLGLSFIKGFIQQKKKKKKLFILVLHSTKDDVLSFFSWPK
jgi:primosomal replication protein N